MPLPAAELVSAADRLLAQDRRQLLTVVVARDRREVLQAAATAGSTEQRKANERNSNRNLNKREARQQPGFSLASAPNGAGTRRVRLRH